MAPNLEVESEPVVDDPQYKRLEPFTADSHKFKLNPIEFPYLASYTLVSLYGAYVLFTYGKTATIIFTLMTVYPANLGVTAAVHRLWSHRSYKVKRPLEIFLLCCFLLTHQRSIITWAKRHRLHHKYSDTDADPHNAARGFLFSHFTWLLYLPHPEVEKRLKEIDVSDLMNIPLVRFQHKYYVPLVIMVGYVIPACIAMLWGESLCVAFLANFVRVMITLTITGTINSISHLVGYRPIDKTVAGTQYTFLALAIMGEGFHNYHHTFPNDCKGSEPADYKYNHTALLLGLLEKLGWAYDLKTTPEEVIKARVLKKGDGTDPYYIPHNEGKQDFFCTQFFHKKQCTDKVL